MRRDAADGERGGGGGGVSRGAGVADADLVAHADRALDGGIEFVIDLVFAAADADGAGGVDALDGDVIRAYAGVDRGVCLRCEAKGFGLFVARGGGGVEFCGNATDG